MTYEEAFELLNSHCLHNKADDTNEAIKLKQEISIKALTRIKEAP